MDRKSRPWLGVCLALVMASGLVACGGGSDSSSAPVTGTDSSSQTDGSSGSDPTAGSSGSDDTQSDDGSTDAGSSQDGDGSADSSQSDDGSTDDGASGDSTAQDDSSSSDDGTATGSDDGSIANQPPQILMSAVSNVVGGRDATIAAQDSYDPDGQIVSINWEQIAGDPVALRQGDTLTPQFTAPDTADTRFLTFALTVTDDQGASTRSSIEFAVHSSDGRLEIFFPCDGCRVFNQRLAVQGIAQGIPGFTGDVAVGTALVSSETTADEDGRWRVDDAVLPDQPTPSIIVVAEAGVHDFNEQIQVERRPTLSSLLVAHDPLNPGSYYFLEDFELRPRLLYYDGLQDRFSAIASWDAHSFDELVDVVLDSNDSRLFALDAGTPRVFVIDTDTGQLEVLSGPDTGSGVALQAPAAIALDGAGRVMVWDPGAGALFTIDPYSGARSVLANNDGRGSGPDLGGRALAIDTVADRAFLFPGSAVLEVDLNFGDRQFLPDAPGRLDSPNSSFYDQRRGQLLTWSDEGPDDLVAINPTDGSTEVISFAHQSNFDLRGARQITHRENQYLISDFVPDADATDRDAVVIVDPASGERTALIEDRLGQGPSLPSAPVLGVNSAANRLFLAGGIPMQVDLWSGERKFVASSGGRAASSARGLLSSEGWLYVLEKDNIWRVSLDGTREENVTGNGRGSGPDLLDARAISLGPDGDVLVADAGQNAVVAVDPESGNRHLLGDNINDGPDLQNLTGIAFDPATQTLLVSDAGTGPGQARLLLVDPVSGERELVAGGPLEHADDVVMLEGGEQALVNERDRILMVDLANGSQTVVSSADVGHGEVFANLQNLTLDRQRDVLYGWSPAREAILLIDVVSGDRAVVAK